MFVVNDLQAGLTIKIVAERTGIAEHTLRAWERRYGVPQPKRVPGNRYRLYDEQDIADVLWMKQQIASGVAPSQASLLLQQQRRPRVLDLIEPSHPIAATQAALQAALLQSDEVTARRILDESFALFAPERVTREIIQPTMVEIGEKWLHREIAVCQEHWASNLVRQKLLAILQSQPAPIVSATHLLAACAPMEEHEIGLLILALLAQRQGWRVSYLGQRTPLADLANLARVSKPNVIAVSVATVVGLAGLIPWLDAANRPKAALVFGGRLPNLLPSLREHLPGTFLGEDALTAARSLPTAEPRAQVWSPSKRAWNVVQSLQAQRFRITGDATAKFMAHLPARVLRAWSLQDLNYATLYLVDALACALAFDVPELIDMQKAWLQAAMPPREVPAQLIAKHLAIFARVLDKTLAADQARQFKSLLARLENGG